MKHLWPYLLLLACASGYAAHAAAQPLTAAQQQAIFPDQKKLIVEDQQDRLSTIEQGKSCAQSAATPEQLIRCVVQEHQQMLQISEQHHNAMLEILRHHGIKPQMHQGKQALQSSSVLLHQGDHGSTNTTSQSSQRPL